MPGHEHSLGKVRGEPPKSVARDAPTSLTKASWPSRWVSHPATSTPESRQHAPVPAVRASVCTSHIPSPEPHCERMTSRSAQHVPSSAHDAPQVTPVQPGLSTHCV